MTVPEQLLAVLIGVVGASILADIGIWRRSLHKDLRALTERLAVVETSLYYISPSAHRRARQDVDGNGEHHP